MHIGIISKVGIQKSLTLANDLELSLKKDHDVWISDVDEIDSYAKSFAKTDVLITLGGDGTILRVARSTIGHDIPILGINLGRVGFMTEIPYEHAINTIKEVLANFSKMRIEERIMISAKGVSNNKQFELNALNDIVLGHQSVSRLMDIDVYVDSAQMAQYRADGIIISSPSGSTGYSLAAGGPIITPEQKLMLIQPIAPHMSLDVGVVVPSHSKISINITSPNKAVVSADGFDEVVLGSTDKIDVEISKSLTKFIRLNPESDFYSQLTTRLKRDVLKNN
ncbi:MAG: NAD(+)/NADH kinase [Dehalococcoidia bacterium]|tara:strand:- start:392 stop:1231 length:840 start_codon:yes stop_codon:yes gene_type:complete